MPYFSKIDLFLTLDRILGLLNETLILRLTTYLLVLASLDNDKDISYIYLLLFQFQYNSEGSQIAPRG